MIDDILTQRHTTHGSFKSNAYISQEIKELICMGDSYGSLSCSQREALDMIVHKIARIVNGNPNDVDHWIDIIGYSQLVVKELK